MKECPRCGICLDDPVLECPSDGSPLETPFEGTALIDGKYRLDRCLGRGGMGAVYRARHIGLDRDVALKLILSAVMTDEGFKKRFRVEAQVLGRLRHPGIVQPSDYGIDPRAGGLPYLVMEYLEGRPLSELVDRGPVPPADALAILEGVAAALDYAHDQSVLHRDLKPLNVFLAGEGSSPATKVLDFGLARFVEQASSGPHADPGEGVDGEPLDGPDAAAIGRVETIGLQRLRGPSTEGGAVERLTQVGPVPGGSPPYMAPEVFQGREATRAYDIYAFGVLAYEVLTGVTPFTGTAEEVGRAHLQSTPPAPTTAEKTLPGEMDEPLLAPLRKDPDARPKSALEVVRGLRSAWTTAEARRWRARELPRRAAMAAACTPVLIAASLLLETLAPVQSLENATRDMRFSLTPTRAPEPRLLVVSVDEATLAADSTPLADKGDEFGAALRGIFEAGARGVAIDFLLPRQWSQSQEFSRLLLERADDLTLAVFSSPAGDVVGTECVSRLTAVALGPERLSNLFGFVNLEEDADGVTRLGRLSYADGSGATRSSWAARAARTLDVSHESAAQRDAESSSFRIDYSIDWRELDRMSWRAVPEALGRDPSAFADRLVLLGGEFAGSGDDYHRVPARPGYPAAVSGLVIQALNVDTIASGLPVVGVTTPLAALPVGLVCGSLLVGLLCRARLSEGVGLFLVLSVGWVVVSYLSFRQARVLLPTVYPLLSLSLALGLGVLLRRALAPFPLRSGEV